MKKIISCLVLPGIALCLQSCATRPRVEPFLNNDTRVWFYNPYSNNNDEVPLPKLGERLKQAGFPPSTRVLIYTDLAVTPGLRAQVQKALINSNSDFNKFGFYSGKK